MTPPDDFSGLVGRVRGTDHRGMFVEVERDVSESGWHIWLLAKHPKEGPSEGWDIWADTWDDVLEWVGPEHLDVMWEVAGR